MMNVYAFRDESLQLYNPPFVATNDKAAILQARNMLLSDRSGSIRALAPKLVLVLVGSFDEASGFLSGCKNFDVIRLSSIYVPEGGVSDDQNVE